MSLLDDVAYRQGVDAGIRQTIERLTKNAQDPARIGKRALAWKFHLGRAEESERLTNFAHRMGISKASACVAANEAQSAILEIRISNTNSNQ
jgi:hypothetical protein